MNKSIRQIQFKIFNSNNFEDEGLCKIVLNFIVLFLAFVSILFSLEPANVLSELYNLSKPKFIAPWISEEEKIKVNIF